MKSSAMPRRPTRRRLAAPAEHDRRPARLVRRRRDPNRSAVVLERLTGPGLLECLHHLGGERGPFRERSPEHLELGRHVTVGDDELDPAFAEQVDDRNVFRDAQRIVERRHHRRDPDAYLVGAGGDGGREREGAGEVAVGRSVVFRQHHADEPEPVGPLDHVEGGAVALGHPGTGKAGIAEIESHDEEAHVGIPPCRPRRTPRSAHGEEGRLTERRIFVQPPTTPSTEPIH